MMKSRNTAVHRYRGIPVTVYYFLIPRLPSQSDCGLGPACCPFAQRQQPASNSGHLHRSALLPLLLPRLLAVHCDCLTECHSVVFWTSAVGRATVAGNLLLTNDAEPVAPTPLVAISGGCRRAALVSDCLDTIARDGIV